MTTCVALEWLNLSRNFVGHKASQLQYCHIEASLIRLKFAKKYKMLWTSEMFYNIIVNKASQPPPNLLWLDREQSLKNSMRYSSWKYCYQKLNILWSRQWRDTPTLLQWGPDSANWTAERTEHFNFKINFWYSLKRRFNSITEFLLYLKIFPHYWMFWIPKTIAMSNPTDWIKDIGPQHLSLALNCPDYKLGLNSDLGMLIAGAWFASLNASVRINQVNGAVLLLACCRNFCNCPIVLPAWWFNKAPGMLIGGQLSTCIRGVPKKRTSWIAILQNRVWG